RRIGLDMPLAQAPAIETLHAGKHARRTRGPAFSSSKKAEQVFFARFFERNFLQEPAELLEVAPVGGKRVFRQPVLEPQRVGKRIQQLSGAQGRRWKVSALASCISSQRLTSMR